MFYEVSNNLRVPKNEMYKTTTNMLQSNSFDKLQIVSDDGGHKRNVRGNNNNITNMTTFDVEIGKNINKIYKERIKMRSVSETPQISKKVTIDSDVKPNNRKSNFNEKQYLKQNASSTEICKHNPKSYSQGPIHRSETTPNLRPHTAQQYTNCKFSIQIIHNLLN